MIKYILLIKGWLFYEGIKRNRSADKVTNYNVGVGTSQFIDTRDCGEAFRPKIVKGSPIAYHG